MRLEIGLLSCVAVVWAVLGLAYALAPWGDMIGYAWVWGVGSGLFVGLTLALRRSARPDRSLESGSADKVAQPKPAS